MSDCIFCKIVKKEIPTEIIFEDEHIMAFNDINPQAPIHLLIIPKKHIPSIRETGQLHVSLLPDIFNAINKLAKQFGVYNNGYRIINNCGDDGGQTVHHLHFHFLAGRQMKWPPG
ncbi:MAG: histidine triad nucleotide-binding protein [Clostridiales bacterium]|nr:histidine triad nucleotide-binding protein [Clostridiales bacterium]